jgi:hypothetical protein
VKKEIKKNVRRTGREQGKSKDRKESWRSCMSEKVVNLFTPPTMGYRIEYPPAHCSSWLEFSI